MNIRKDMVDIVTILHNEEQLMKIAGYFRGFAEQTEKDITELEIAVYNFAGILKIIIEEPDV